MSSHPEGKTGNTARAMTMEEQRIQQEASKNEPEFLYHYTTAKGLYGILEKECIWATHYRFLNDLSECLEAAESFEAKIRQQSSTQFSQLEISRDVRQAHCNNILNTLRAQIESTDAYFVSFTDESTSQTPGDRLTLWRGYGENSQGFSLGFRRSKLKQRVNFFEQQLRKQIPLKQCLYGETDESELEREAIIGTLVGFLVLPNSQVLEKVLQWSAQFKNGAFYEEREWRFVLQISKAERESNGVHIEFHDGRFGRTPHIAIPLDLKGQDSPLERIVVSPAPDKEQVATRLKINLLQMGIHGVEVVASEIPCRNW
jgi:hypothetical protein